MGEYICPKCGKKMCETKEACVVCRHCLFRCSIDWLSGWYAALNSGAQPQADNIPVTKLPLDILEKFKQQSEVFKGVTHLPSFAAGATAYHEFIERQLRASA